MLNPHKSVINFNLLLLLKELVGAKMFSHENICRINQIYRHGLCLRPNVEKEGQTCQSPRGGEEACGLA